MSEVQKDPPLKRCPVCRGNGYIALYFGVTGGNIGITDSNGGLDCKICKECNGKGRVDQSHEDYDE